MVFLLFYIRNESESWRFGDVTIWVLDGCKFCSNINSNEASWIEFRFWRLRWSVSLNAMSSSNLNNYKNGIPKHKMKTAISMSPIMSGNNLKEFEVTWPWISNRNSGGSKKIWHAYALPDHLQILNWIKNYSPAYRHG